MTRGIALPALVAIIAAVLVAGGALYYNLRPEGELMMDKGKEMMEEGEKMVEEGDAMLKEGEKMMEEGEAMMEKEEGEVMYEGSTGDGPMSPAGITYYGEVLAQSPAGAFLLDFNKSDYENAIMNEKLVVLYFYANWCPVCRAEFPVMQEVFNELDESVVAFRVNYNDNQTDDYERGLARQYGVAYQHTKVFLKYGERVLKSPESWNKDRYLSEIEGAL